MSIPIDVVSNRPDDVAAVQDKYAARIKKRLAQPRIDVLAARDGILDCYVATYFGGLKQGIAGYLGIDASEEQVAQVAQGLFKKRLLAHGVSFESPTVDALDRVKEEVDRELHINELPGELRGLHDQVCNLLLSKADGALVHHGDQSAVRGSQRPHARTPAPPPQATPRTVPPSHPPASHARVSQAPASHPPASHARVSQAPASHPPASHARVSQAPASHPPASHARVSQAPASHPPSNHSPHNPTAHAAHTAPASGSVALPPSGQSVEDSLRGALAVYLDESAAFTRRGLSARELQTRLARIEKLISLLADFEG